MTTYQEWNFDGLVGPTHHYAGLALGNLASKQHAFHLANPQAAALQGLSKMRLLCQLGIKQAILPPYARPNLGLLTAFGFEGPPVKQLAKAAREAPALLSAAYSASNMWTANTATVSASKDTHDGKVHLTAANLSSLIHRQQEAAFSDQLLRRLFLETHFNHHAPIPPSAGDEGAANYSRFCQTHAHEGVALFVYGKQKLLQHMPLKYPARQTLEASAAVARQHGLKPERVCFAQQLPEAIEAGVFHNDVVGVGNESVLFLHEFSFVDQARVLRELQEKASCDLTFIEIPASKLSLHEAIATYLFNSQLVTLPNRKMAWIAPKICETNPATQAIIQDILHDATNPIDSIHYVDLTQSLQNGGGPACLRLRMPLSEAEVTSVHPGLLMNETKLDHLEAWVKRHYRTALHFGDLADPSLMDESYAALDDLTRILDLGACYPFQQ